MWDRQSPPNCGWWNGCGHPLSFTSGMGKQNPRAITTNTRGEICLHGAYVRELREEFMKMILQLAPSPTPKETVITCLL